jgi:hypothetical protein
MKKRKACGSGMIGLFVLVFILTAVSHDYFCHDELHTVCGPLHTFFAGSETPATENILGLPPSLPLLTWNQDQILRPEFVKNIFHPPD